MGMLRKSFLLLFVIQLLTFALHSQNRAIDSLRLLLKKENPDTGKVSHLNALSQEFMSISSY